MCSKYKEKKYKNLTKWYNLRRFNVLNFSANKPLNGIKLKKIDQKFYKLKQKCKISQLMLFIHRHDIFDLDIAMY